MTQTWAGAAHQRSHPPGSRGSGTCSSRSPPPRGRKTTCPPSGWASRACPPGRSAARPHRRACCTRQSTRRRTAASSRCHQSHAGRARSRPGRGPWTCRPSTGPASAGTGSSSSPCTPLSQHCSRTSRERWTPRLAVQCRSKNTLSQNQAPSTSCLRTQARDTPRQDTPTGRAAARHRHSPRRLGTPKRLQSRHQRLCPEELQQPYRQRHPSSVT
mmetsp:Transcript_44571/g.133048  ORF Transcript_44571/g.133048 Transcript_44571/m.133048 type:complete len:215 (-) Transcript_44571:217-861(-)